MRMTLGNWRRFHAGKKTTIRVKRLKTGVHDVCGGARFKPFHLGKLEIGSPALVTGVRRVRQLTEEDARNDGFDNLIDLIIELARLNRELTGNTTVYIHPAKIVKDDLNDAVTLP